VLTSITVQNTQTVKKIIPLSVEDIQNQIECVIQDIPVKYVKTGLLYQPEIAAMIAKISQTYKWNLIVDPVLVATSGDSLHTTNLIDEMKNSLLPVSTLIAPNISEAETITNTKINNTETMKQAAKIIHSMGVKNIIIKGGHLEDENATDILFDGNDFFELSLPRIPKRKAHGSGCTFSALLTGLLAQGNNIQSAFTKSKHILWNMINNGYNIGKGSDVLQINTTTVTNASQHFPSSTHANIWMEISKNGEKILDLLPLQFTPEVGINIGYALPTAKTKKDICALNGRIIRSKNQPMCCGSFQFGSSKHIASIILAVMEKYPNMRSAMNIKYSKENLDLCKTANFHIGSFDRKNEPKNASSSMEWGTQKAIEQSDNCPDLIYDEGGIGKEPMIRIIGKNPKEPDKKLSIIIKHYENI
jgi:hydroxymethylpyrimidine/phosphomethylpyrimidine kinase